MSEIQANQHKENYAIRHFHIDHSAPCVPPQPVSPGYYYPGYQRFLARGGNFRCRPKADKSSALQSSQVEIKDNGYAKFGGGGGGGKCKNGE